MGDPGPPGVACPASAVIVAIFCLLWFVLRHRGLRVQILATIWITSLVVTQLSMKALTSPPFNFRFPALVTILHFASTWGVCVVHWSRVGDLGKCRWTSIGSARRYAMNIVPVACSLPMSVILNNQAMMLVGVAVNAVIGTLTPVATAVLSHFVGRSLPLVSWGGVAVACVGAVIITWGESRSVFTAGAPSVGPLGFFLSFSAVLCRSCKAVIQDRMLKPSVYSKGKHIEEGLAHDRVDYKPLEPLHVWALQAPPCCAMSAFAALTSESLPTAWSRLTPGVIGIIFGTCISATTVNLLGLFTVKELGATSTQIVGKLNTIVTVSLSVSLLGERLAPEVLGGAVIVLLGVSIFEAGNSGHGIPLPRSLLRLRKRWASLEPPIGV